jgi:hypothetical protein
MSEEVMKILRNYIEVTKMAVSWREGKIPAGLAMEQISYILTDVAPLNSEE